MVLIFKIQIFFGFLINEDDYIVLYDRLWGKEKLLVSNSPSPMNSLNTGNKSQHGTTSTLVFNFRF